jgi:hypothetical protein
MRLYLRHETVAWLVRRGYWFAMVGAILIILAIGPWHDVGFVSGLMLLLFGGCTGAFRNWRQERGLWMLAVVALCAWLPLYAAIQWDAIKRELNGQRPRPVLLAWDVALAASIVWLQVRFLWTVARVNWTLFAKPRAADARPAHSDTAAGQPSD